MRLNKALDKVATVVTDKHTRSTFFLFLTVIIIFVINGLLPTIEGKAHYTADPVNVTYAEYKEMKAKDSNHNLTWSSEEDINNYNRHYMESHPDAEYLLIEPPDDFKVSVYTKFFFQHTFWYVSTLTRTVSAVLLFYSIFNYLLTKYKDTHRRYKELSDELIKLSNNSLDPSTFEPWMIDDFNRVRKIKQHTININYRLSMLDRRTSYVIRNLAKKDPDNPKCARYLNKKNDLLSKLEPTYINEVVINKYVPNFKYIHPSFVLCGVNKMGHTTDSYSLIQSDSSRLSKDIMTKALLAMFLTVMFATLLTITVVVASDKPWYWVVIDVLTTVAPLLIQIPMAYDYCNTYMEEHLITNLLYRRSIAFTYLADMQKKGEPKDEKDITTD